MVRYLSICSGIEAATVAWQPLGWQACAFAEIDRFPRAVLRHHYPDVPLHGDFTTIEADQYGPVDLLVGGTPCQSFSVAGLRGGLADHRGNLALEFLRLAQRTRPHWLVWENVPGVLSSNGGRDFGAIIGGMVECGYGVFWRVLDAHYFGVPQRRRRVFVVGYLGDWRRAAAVLLERESLRRDSPPRREAGKGIAPTISARPTGGGGIGTDFDLDGGVIVSHDSAVACQTIASTLNAQYGSKQGLEDQHVNQGCPLFVTHSLRGEGFDTSEDGTGRGTPLVPVAFQSKASASNSMNPSGVAPSLDVGKSDGIAIAFSCKDHGADAGQSHANAGGQVAIAIQERAVSEGTSGPVGKGWKEDVAYTLEARNKAQNVAHGYAVRCLTPRECERLQGFPDDYTAIPWRGKPTDQCPDGPRYKALGNSMAVPVMRWIGERIEVVNSVS